MCRQFIEPHLKTQSVARFNTTDKTGRGGGPLLIEIAVDSQNSFGAMLRTNFGCKVERTNGQWKLRKLETK